nr:MAG TPA: hypothetical protein [Caudoviricetes sp.]
MLLITHYRKEKTTCLHHQNQNCLLSMVILISVPYLLLSLGLSFLPNKMEFYICVLLYFLRTYPCCINHHIALILFGTSYVG